MASSARTAVLVLALLGTGLTGCGRKEPAPAPVMDRGDEPVEDPSPVAPPPAPPIVPPPIAENAAAPADGYAGTIRTRLLAGDATVVRGSLPAGAIAAVGAVRRALGRADPAERAAALKAVETLADLLERQATFLSATDAVQQGAVQGVNLPGWVAPVLRAVAAGPAASAELDSLSDASLIDGTVSVLLEDPAFRRGLERWRIAADVPRIPPPPEDGTPPGEELVGTVVLVDSEAAAGRVESTILLIASEGRWVPVVIEATAPVWAAKADSAGGTGAAAVFAAAGPHLKAALAAETQGEFDTALRAATDAALATAADPPAPVPDADRVTVELTRPLTARQAADLLGLMEAATDDPARAVARAAPRSGGAGWRVTVGPVKDVSAWIARLPLLAGATMDDRTVTVPYEPPPRDDAELEPGDAGGAD